MATQISQIPLKTGIMDGAGIKPLTDKIMSKVNDVKMAISNFHASDQIGEMYDIRRLQRMRMEGSGAGRRTFGITDYNWSYQNELTMVDKNGVQQMILQEFQPDPIFDVGKMIDATLQGLQNAFGGQTAPAGTAATTDAKGFLGPFFGSLAAGVAAGSVQPLTELALMKAYYNNERLAIQFPMDLIKKMFPGVYLGTFHLPYFDEYYIESSSDRGDWDMGGSQRVLGSKLSSVLRDSMNIDFPTAPTWKHNVKSGSSGLNNKFYLINDSTENLVKNFKFLHALISGTFWMQLSIMQKSPNIYKVIVPGRFTKWVCDMSCTVTMDGKLRMNQQAAGMVAGQMGAQIGPGTLFPDVYKVDLKITDLAPNHFNNYMDYLVNGDSVSQPGIQQGRAVTNPLDIGKELYKDIGAIL
jgi:hypothetical protein